MNGYDVYLDLGVILRKFDVTIEWRMYQYNVLYCWMSKYDARSRESNNSQRVVFQFGIHIGYNAKAEYKR
jgi:hypothetical protein